MFNVEWSWLISLVPALFITLVSLSSIFILVYAYIKLRPKFPIRVDCWFCHKSSDVPYDNRNCWDCPYCEQYNGFSPDGGYNKVIPAQHDELLNHSVSANSSFSKKNPVSGKNPLCRKCTINQDLKIHQLASFTPRDPAHFDEEVEEYRLHLERAYRLCDSCKHVVRQTLQKQQGWLLDQHRKCLFSIKSRPNQRVIAWWQRGFPLHYLHWVQISSTVTALSLLIIQSRQFLAEEFSMYLSPDLAYVLEVAPNYDHVIASIMTCVIIVITGCSTRQRRVDVVTCILWLVMLIHKWLLVGPYLKNEVSEDDLKLGHIIVIALTFVVNTVAIVTSRQVCPKNLAVKRLRPENEKTHRGRNIAERFYSMTNVPSLFLRRRLC